MRLSSCAVVSLSLGPFSQPRFPTWTPDPVSSTAIARLIRGMWVVLAKTDEALVIKGISRRAVSTLLLHLHTAWAAENSCRHEWVDPEMHLVQQQQGIFQRTNSRFHCSEKHACNDTCAVAIGMVLLTLPWYAGVHLYERKEWRAEIGSWSEKHSFLEEREQTERTESLPSTTFCIFCLPKSEQMIQIWHLDQEIQIVMILFLEKSNFH